MNPSIFQGLIEKIINLELKYDVEIVEKPDWELDFDTAWDSLIKH